MAPPLPTLTLLLGSAAAYRSYMVNIPNSDRVPCYAAITFPNCHAGMCEAFGHASCNPTSPRTAFADEFEQAGSSGGGGREDDSLASKSQWTVGVCSTDSDGDGFTNGDELGDPCCAWSHSAVPTFTTGISNPSDPGSVPPRGSCSSGGPPAPPTNVTFTYASASSVTLSWTPPPAASCSCEFNVIAAVGGVAQAAVRARGSSYTFCGLPAATSVTATVSAVKRGSLMSPATSAGAGTSTLPAGGAGNIAVCSASASFIDTAGTAGVFHFMEPQIALVWPAIALITVCAVGLLTIYCWVDPLSSPRDLLVHKYIGGGVGIKWLAPPVAGLGTYATYALALGALVSTWATSYVFYSQYMVYGLGQQAAAERALGYTLACAVGLQLLPVTRWSVWLHALGVPFERGVRFHRWTGLVTMALVVLHGALITWRMSSSRLGLAWVVLYSTTEPVNPAAGLISGVLMLTMGLLSIDVVRRRSYELFLLGHSLWPWVLLFGYLHTSHSQTPAIYPFAPGFCLLLLDVLLLMCDTAMRPTRILDCGPIYEHGSSSGNTNTQQQQPIVAFMVLQKASPAWWPFRYVSGQFVYLSIPGVSLWPHPYSISSAPNASFPGRFTVHVKSMGKGTWSEAVVTRLCAGPTSTSNTAGQQQQQPQSTPIGVVTYSGAGNDAQHAAGGSNNNGSGGTPIASVASTAHVNFAYLYAARLLPSILTTGPFGYPSVQLERYAHFILIGGGIGITPIAALHASLARGAPVSPPNSLPFLSGVWEGKSDGAARVCTLSTVWMLREKGLLEEFAPLLSLAGAPPLGLSSYGTVAATKHQQGQGQGQEVEASPISVNVYLTTGKARPAAQQGQQQVQQQQGASGDTSRMSPVAVASAAGLSGSTRSSSVDDLSSATASVLHPLPQLQLASGLPYMPGPPGTTGIVIIPLDMAQQQKMDGRGGGGGVGASAALTAASNSRSGSAGRPNPVSFVSPASSTTSTATMETQRPSHITAPRGTNSSGGVPLPADITLNTGRPDFPGILRDAAVHAGMYASSPHSSWGTRASASSSVVPMSAGGRVPIAIIVCGPEAMVESVFAAAAGVAASAAGRHVEFHIHRETFLL